MLLMSVYKTVTEKIKVMFFSRFATDIDVFLSGSFIFHECCCDVIEVNVGKTGRGKF